MAQPLHFLSKNTIGQQETGGEHGKDIGRGNRWPVTLTTEQLGKNTNSQLLHKGETTMNAMKKSLAAIALGTAALTASSNFAYAADDYVVIKAASELGLGDPSTAGKSEKRAVTFTLPANVDLTKPAILQIRQRGVNFTHNAVYLNPTGDLGTPSSIFGCTDESTDPNSTKKVGNLDAHPTAPNSEVFPYHQVVSGSFLKAGTNALAICARGSDGREDTSATSADDGVNNDDFGVSSIVLHFKTNP
jgi:hypothetical protein